MSDLNAKHLMCRGKAAKGWVEGYFLPRHPMGGSEGPVIVQISEKYAVSLCVPVLADTVTSCSGLLDKKGRLIYDQDILFDEERRSGGIVEYAEEDGMFALVERDGTLRNFCDVISSNYEIVGNAFDNPDYLEFI